MTLKFTVDGLHHEALYW